MIEFTQKQLKEMVKIGMAIDISNGNNDTRKEIIAKEGYLDRVGFSLGANGTNGRLLKGNNTNQLYAVVGHVSAIYIF